MTFKCMCPVYSMPKGNIEDFFKKLEPYSHLTIRHHLKFDDFEYYVARDPEGNNMDFVCAPDVIKEDGYYGVRINIDRDDDLEEVMKEFGAEFIMPTRKFVNGECSFIRTGDGGKLFVFCHKR